MSLILRAASCGEAGFSADVTDCEPLPAASSGLSADVTDPSRFLRRGGGSVASLRAQGGVGGAERPPTGGRGGGAPSQNTQKGFS